MQLKIKSTIQDKVRYTLVLQIIPFIIARLIWNVPPLDALLIVSSYITFYGLIFTYIANFEKKNFL